MPTTTQVERLNFGTNSDQYTHEIYIYSENDTVVLGTIIQEDY